MVVVVGVGGVKKVDGVWGEEMSVGVSFFINLNNVGPTHSEK